MLNCFLHTDDALSCPKLGHREKETNRLPIGLDLLDHCPTVLHARKVPNPPVQLNTTISDSTVEMIFASRFVSWAITSFASSMFFSACCLCLALRPCKICPPMQNAVPSLVFSPHDEPSTNASPCRFPART